MLAVESTEQVTHITKKPSFDGFFALLAAHPLQTADQLF
jgi:hypothetical protein